MSNNSAKTESIITITGATGDSQVATSTGTLAIAEMFAAVGTPTAVESPANFLLGPIMKCDNGFLLANF